MSLCFTAGSPSPGTKCISHSATVQNQDGSFFLFNRTVKGWWLRTPENVEP